MREIVSEARVDNRRHNKRINMVAKFQRLSPRRVRRGAAAIAAATDLSGLELCHVLYWGMSTHTHFRNNEHRAAVAPADTRDFVIHPQGRIA